MDFKRKILICPGPEYLFWAMGIYYCTEISSKYDVILVADHQFKERDKVENFIKSGVIKFFYQCPDFTKINFSLLRIFKRHLFFSRISKQIFNNHKIEAILQHTDLEVANLYLYTEAKKRGIYRIMYRPSAIPKNYYQDYSFIKNWATSKVQKKIRNRQLSILILHSVILISYILNYYVFPAIISSQFFRRRIKIFPNKKDYFNSNTPFYSSAVVHSERDARITALNNEPSDIIRSPLKSSWERVFKILKIKIKSNNQILIVPTSGEYQQYLNENNTSNNKFCMLWVNAIQEINKKYPDYRILIKCHPMADDNHIYDHIIKETKINNIIKISHTLPVESILINSKIIVGTVSSCLLWASELDLSKIIISLDLFGINGGDKYSDVNNISYINTISKLKNIKPLLIDINNVKEISLIEYIEKNTC
jgi:hypothetical protein